MVSLGRGVVAVGLGGLLVVAGAVHGSVSAGTSADYVVVPGVEVIEVSVVGASGGGIDAGEGFTLPGGSGCQVRASFAVVSGDSVTSIGGVSGGSTVPSATDTVGGAGGAGARPGGDGGAVVSVFGTPLPGAGGGGASSLSINGSEVVVAAGGGGASLSGGGSGCADLGPEGGQGFGSQPTAGGGVTADVGGAGGLGNGGSSSPPPGASGNSALDSPPGKGGAGGDGNFGGFGGGGGGGGVSGGGGGAGTFGQFGGGTGSGAAGLSTAPSAPQGIAAPSFSPGPEASGSASVFAVVIATDDLPAGDVGSPYNVNLAAEFSQMSGPVQVAPALFIGTGPVWSLAPQSDPLPAGLTLNAAGTISGAPTVATTAQIVLSAEVYDDVGDARARTVVAFELVVTGAAPTTTSAPSTTQAPTTTVPSSTVPAHTSGSGTLPATGVSGVAPLIATGLALVGSGAITAAVTRRRRT